MKGIVKATLVGFVGFFVARFIINGLVFDMNFGIDVVALLVAPALEETIKHARQNVNTPAQAVVTGLVFGILEFAICNVSLHSMAMPLVGRIAIIAVKPVLHSVFAIMPRNVAIVLHYGWNILNFVK